MTGAARATSDVVARDAPATGAYLHSSRDAVVQFALCDTHVAQVRDGGRSSSTTATGDRRSC